MNTKNNPHETTFLFSQESAECSYYYEEEVEAEQRGTFLFYLHPLHLHQPCKSGRGGGGLMSCLFFPS